MTQKGGNPAVTVEYMKNVPKGEVKRKAHFLAIVHTDPIQKKVFYLTPGIRGERGRRLVEAIDWLSSVIGVESFEFNAYGGRNPSLWTTKPVKDQEEFLKEGGKVIDSQFLIQVQQEKDRRHELAMEGIDVPARPEQRAAALHEHIEKDAIPADQPPKPTPPAPQRPAQPTKTVHHPASTRR